MAESLQPPIPDSHSPAEARRPTGSLATDRGIFAIAMPAIKHTYSFTDSQLGLLSGANFARGDRRPAKTGTCCIV
jgi:hypothetical protein